MAHRIVDEYEPFDRIVRGDVILLNGHPRTVRHVGRGPEDAVQSIYVVKLRRSGYPAPYTIKGRSEIRDAFGGVVGHRKDGLRSTPLEAKLQDYIDAEGRYCERDGNGNRRGPRPPSPPPVTERDVVGLIW